MHRPAANQCPVSRLAATKSISSERNFISERHRIASMWRRTVCAVSLAIGYSLAAFASQVSEAAARGDDEQAIRRVIDQIENASANNDADALSKLWASDC